MSTPLNASADKALISAKAHLKAFDLDKALAAIDQSLQKSQQDTGSDLSFYGNMLWCKILLAKGRFSKDLSFPKLALTQLSALSNLIPQVKESVAFLSLHFLTANAYSQINQPEKAKEIYQNILSISLKAEYDIGKIQALNGLAKLAITTNENELALDLANQSLELLIQHTNEDNYDDLAINYLLQSAIFKQKGDFSQAKNYAERALAICEERHFKELAINAHLHLGKVAIELKENVLAITHLLTAKEQSMAISHTAFLAESILHVGIVYHQVFHYPKALEKFQLIEEQYQKVLKDADKILLLNYLGKAYFQSYDNEAAKKYFLAAEQQARLQHDKAALVLCLAYLGKICRRQSEYDRALRYAKKVNDLTKQIGDVDGVQVNLINLGNVHNKLEKYNEGIKLASRGIAAAKRMKDGLSEIRGYQIMAEIFRKKKDYKSAVMYQMIYTKFYEDFYQRNDRQQVADVEHRFVIDKLERKIRELTKK